MEGNALFDGNVTQNGNLIVGDGLTFGKDTPITINALGTEPENLLVNPDVEENLGYWEHNGASVTQTNQTRNPEFETDTSYWESNVTGGSFPEQFSNPGIDTDLDQWTLQGGGLGEEIVNHYTSFNTALVYGSSTLYRNGIGSPGGGQIIFDNDGKLLYPTNGGGGYSIIRIDPVTGGFINAHGQVPSGGNQPFGLATINQGGIDYVYKTSGHAGALYRGIGKILPNNFLGPTSSITSFWRQSDISRGPSSGTLAVDSANNLWVTKEYTNNIEKIDIDTGAVLESYNLDSVGTIPHWIAIDSQDYIWVTLCGNGRIVRIDSADGSIVGDYPYSGNGITYYDNGIWYTEGANAPIYLKKMNIYTGSVEKSIEIYPSVGSSPGGMTFGPDGLPWVGFAGSFRLAKFSITGPEHVTGIGSGGSSGSLYVPSYVDSTYFTQEVNLGDNNQYELTGYVQSADSSAIDESVVVLTRNFSDITTSYQNVGGGWYRLRALVQGSTSDVAYGLHIKAENEIYVDEFSLKQVPETWKYNPYYSAGGTVSVESPSTSTTAYTQTLPFVAGNTYSLELYAYTNGSTVTSGDLELYFDGATIPTTITSTATAGWYKLSGTFTPTATGAYEYGALVKASKSVYIDSVSLTSPVDTNPVYHVTEETHTTYQNSEGSVRINAVGSTPVTYTQEVEVPAGDTYSLIAQVYNNTPGEEGLVIDSSKVKLTINGNPVAGAEYNPSAGGYYTIQAQTYLDPGSNPYTVGIQVESGYEVLADSFSLSVGSGTDRVVNIINAGTGVAKLNVESTIMANAGKPELEALTVTGAAGQTANLTTWYDFDGSVLGAFTGEGDFGINTGKKFILDFDDIGDTYLSHDSANNRINTYVDGVEVMRIKDDGTVDVKDTINTSAFDIAETYPTYDEGIEAGDVVSLNTFQSYQQMIADLKLVMYEVEDKLQEIEEGELPITNYELQREDKLLITNY